MNRPGIGSAPTILRKVKIFFRSILNAMHEEIKEKLNAINIKKE